MRRYTTSLESGQDYIKLAEEALGDDKIEDAIEYYEKAVGFLKNVLKEDSRSQLAKNLLKGASSYRVIIQSINSESYHL